MAEKDPYEGQLPPVERGVHRRLLEYLNNARRRDDLEILHDAEIGHEAMAEIIRGRDRVSPFGFRHLREVVEVARINPEILRKLIALFGRATYGEWITPYETKFPDGTAYHVAHAAVLKTGWVLFLPEANTKTTLLWDPSDEVNPLFEHMVDTPDELLFCSGHAFLSDGRLLVAGGGGGGPSGVNRAWKFDPDTKTWTKTAGDMTHARWYPTVVTMSDERRMLVVGGSPSIGTAEVYDEFTDTFTLLTGPDATRNFPQLYPGLHLLPGGEVFYTRTGFGSAGPGPGGPNDPLPTNSYFNYNAPATGAWVELPNQMEYIDRVRGMSVLLLDPCDPTVRVMVIGGGAAPGNETAEIVTLATLNPTWGHPMIIPGGSGRNNVNAVLLPDSTVMVVGGTADPSIACALYRPATDTWAAMDPVNYRKQYHSVAVLLPSGKVMATGGSNYGGGSNVIEIFSPPYLFKSDGSPADRPVIDNAPGLVHHGDSFAVESADAADIERVVLVRPMAVTHQTDSEQRVIQMAFRQSGSTLTVTAPDPDHPHGTAPRGHYMLFILNNAGVPSEGRFIFLH